MMKESKYVFTVIGLLCIGSTAVLADSYDRHHESAYNQFSSSYRDPQLMLTSDNVRDVQQALATQGFYDGAIDGKWGSHSQAAMRSFQQSQGHKPTGMITGAALDSLGVQVSDRTRESMYESEANVRRNMRSNEH